MTKMMTVLMAAAVAMMVVGCGASSSYRVNEGYGLDNMGPYGQPMMGQQNASRYRPLGGCGEELSVKIDNPTPNWQAIHLDGVPVAHNATRAVAGMQMPVGQERALPPNGATYVCLDRPGTHEVTTVMYSSGGAGLVRVGSYTRQYHWGQLPMGAHHHTVHLSTQRNGP